MSLTLICHPSNETAVRMLWKLGLVDADTVVTNKYLKVGTAYVFDTAVLEQGYRRAFQESTMRLLFDPWKDLW